MSSGTVTGKGFTIPPMYGEDQHPSNRVETATYVLTFLREFMGGFNNELPLTEDAMFGFALVLDGVIQNLQQAREKM